MSQIPVGIGVTWDSTAARAGMKTFENELGQWSRRISQNAPQIPVKLDIGGASVALDEFYRSANKDPLKIRVIADDLAIRTQLDFLIETYSAKPIVIPVMFQQVGGMPAGMVPAGGGGGSSAAAAAAMLAAPTSTPAAALAGGMGTTYGYLRGGYYPPAPLMASPSMGAAAAAESGAWTQWGTMGAAAAGAAGVAGGAAAVGGGGEFFNMRALRKIMGGMMVGEAGFHTAAGLVDAVRAGFTSDNAQNAKLIESGQHSISRFPVIGDLISETGELAERGVSATKNLARGRGFESDLAYGERVEAEAKALDKHTKEVERAAEIRRHANDALEREIVTNNRAGATDGIRGSIDRAAMTEAVRRSELTAELKKPQYLRRDGTLTDTAKAFRDSELGRLDADATKRRRQESEAYGALADTADVAEAEARGDMTGARRLRFNQEQQTQAKAAFNLGYGQGDYYWRRVAPAQSQAFNREEVARKAGQDADHSDRMTAAGNRGTEAALRIAGESEIAVAQHRNDLEDQLVAKLERRAAIELDAARKVELTQEAAAEREAAVIVKRANLMDATLRRTLALEDVRHGTQMIHLEAEGRGYEAQRSDIQARLNRSVAEARGDADKVKDARDRAAAETEMLGTNRGRILARIGSDTTQIRLRSQGHPDVAEVVGIRDDMRQQLKEAVGDPEMRRAILGETAAKMGEFLHGSDQPRIFNSVSDYAQSVQMSVLNRDPKADEMARQIADMCEKMAAAADKILGSQPLYSIGN